MSDTAIAEAVKTENPAKETAPRPGLQSVRAMITGATTEKVVKAEPVKAAVVETVTKPTVVSEVKKEVTQVAVVDEVEDYLKSVTPKSKDRFNELAEKKAEAKFQEKLKTIKQLTPDFEEKLTAAESRRIELENEIKQVAVERSPEYKAKFVDRPKSIKASLSEFAKTWEIPESELLSAVEGGKDTRRQLNTLLETIGSMDRADVTELAREYQKIQDDRTKVLSDHELASKLLMQKRNEDTKAGIEKLIATRSTALKESIIPQVEKEYGSIFQGEDGEKLKTNLLASVEHLNACDLENMKPEDRAAMVACAFMARPAIEKLNTALARITELEEKLAKADAGAPVIGGRSTSTQAEEKQKNSFQKMRSELNLP